MKEKDNNHMIKASRGPTAIVIIYIIITGIVMIVFLLACLDVFSREGSKSCLYIAVVFWIIYSCFFWASFTYQIKANKAKGGLYCAYNSLAHNALYGNKGSSEAYVGVKNLNIMSNNMQIDLETLNDKKEAA